MSTSTAFNADGGGALECTRARIRRRGDRTLAHRRWRNSLELGCRGVLGPASSGLRHRFRQLSFTLALTTSIQMAQITITLALALASALAAAPVLSAEVTSRP